jgi:hypothetical protein
MWWAAKELQESAVLALHETLTRRLTWSPPTRLFIISAQLLEAEAEIKRLLLLQDLFDSNCATGPNIRFQARLGDEAI